MREHKYLRELDIDGTQKEVGNYEFKWNQTIYVSLDGTIYATEIGLDNGCNVKIDTNGVSSFLAKNLISKLDREKDQHNDLLLGITEDDNGNIYVAETAGKRIIKILKDGESETFYTSEERWLPTAIDFLSGVAYILEFKESSSEKGPRIVKINESGKRTILFDYDTYQKNKVLPVVKTKNNYIWWVFPLLGVFIFVLIVELRKRKTTVGKL